MSLHNAFSWPSDPDGAARARDCFNTLRAGRAAGKRFALDGQPPPRAERRAAGAGQLGHSQGAKSDRTVRVWRVPHGTPVVVFDDLTPPPHAVAVSPDGRFVAVAPDGEPIRLYEP